MERITVGATELAVSDVSQGPAVVLVGGTGMPPVAWELCGFVDGLVAAGYRVITFAARGVNPSHAPPGPYTIEEMANDVAEIIVSLSVAPCCVVGYSLGGFQAEYLARTRPELLRGAALIASAGPLSAVLDAVLDATGELLERLGSVPASVAVFEGLVGELPPAMLREDADQVALWRELLAVQHDMWTSADGEVGQWHAARRWTNDEHRLDALVDIAVPTLVVSYEHDLKFPPIGARLAASQVPECQVVEIAGAAHGGLMTHTSDTLAAVLSFLATVVSGER